MLSILRCETAKVWKKAFLLTCVSVCSLSTFFCCGTQVAIALFLFPPIKKVAEELQDLTPDERADFIEKQQERASALYALEQIDFNKGGMGELGETQITRLKEEKSKLRKLP